MKNVFLMAFAILLVCFTGCSESDEPVIEKTKVSFIEVDHEEKESAGTLEIKVKLSEAVAFAESLQIGVTSDGFENPAEEGVHYRVEKIIQPTGDIATIEVELIDNTDENTKRQFAIELIEDDNYGLGDMARCVVSILDDDLIDAPEDHPYAHLVGYYTGKVTYVTNKKSEDLEAEWSMRITVDPNDYSNFYIDGFSGTTTKVAGSLEDPTFGYLDENAFIMGAYDGLAVEGEDLTGKKCPLAKVKIDGDAITPYIPTVEVQGNGDLFFADLAIAVEATSETYLVEHFNLTMEKN